MCLPVGAVQAEQVRADVCPGDRGIGESQRLEVRKIMKFKIRFGVITVALAVFALASIGQVSAQHSQDHNGKQSWKKGMVRLSRTAWVGNVKLERGMYHVKHVTSGDKHWLVFKEVSLRAGYMGGLMWEGKELARIECRVEPAEKSLRNTKVTLAKSANAYVIEQIQIAGERVRHVLINSPQV